MAFRAPIQAGLVMFACGLVGTARAQLATITLIDFEGNLGSPSAIAYGPDGLALISYYDGLLGDLKLARCLDVACTTFVTTTLDSTGDVGTDASIAIGAGGRAFIAYTDVTNAAVKLARCVDAACSSATLMVVDALAPLATRGVAVAIGPDDRPVIAYGDGGGQPLRVARCTDADCAGVSIVPLPEPGGEVALAIGSDGLPLIASVTSGFRQIRVRHCLDSDCSSSTASYLPWAFMFPTSPTEQFAPRLSVGPDGLARISHDLYASSVSTPPIPPQVQIHTYVRRCANVACTGIAATYPVAPGVGVSASGYDANGEAVAARSAVAGGLVFARCSTPSCPTLGADLVLAQDVSPELSMARGPAGRYLIAFCANGGSLRTAYLDGTATADLSLATTDVPDPAVPGQTVTYGLHVTNHGPHTARLVTAHVVLSPGLELVATPAGCAYDATAHALDCTSADIAAAGFRDLPDVRVRPLPLAPGDLVSTASVASATADPDLSDNTAVITTRLDRWLEVAPITVVEPDGVVVPSPFRVTLRDTTPPGPSTATVAFATVAGTAQAGTDYQAVSGVVTFPPGTTTQTVEVGIVGDAVAEAVETFVLQLSNPVGASLLVPSATGTILDDDVGALLGELVHGSARTEALTPASSAPTGTHFYRIVQAPFASYEVVVDAASGDLLPLGLARLGGGGTGVLQIAVAEGTGSSVRLAWVNSTSSSEIDQLVRVTSGSCTTGCADDDAYRIRAYETTLRGPRFNNSGGQVTVLALQNPTARAVAGRAWFFRANGTLAGSSPLALGPHASLALNTATIASSTSGSVVVAHDAPFGALAGKLVALEPATGLAFDTPLEVRPR